MANTKEIRKQISSISNTQKNNQRYGDGCVK